MLSMFFSPILYLDEVCPAPSLYQNGITVARYL